MKVVAVQFPGSARQYDYFCGFDDAEVGDEVTVETRRGMATVKIVAIKPYSERAEAKVIDIKKGRAMENPFPEDMKPAGKPAIGSAEMPHDPKGNLPMDMRPLTETLPVEFESLIEDIAKLLTEAREKLPAKFETEQHNSDAGEFVKSIRKLITRAGNEKDAKKRPYLDANITIEDFFKPLISRLGKAKEVIEDRGTAFLKARAAAELARRIEAERIAREEAAELLRKAQIAEEAGKAVHADMAVDDAAKAEKRADQAAAAQEERPADMARQRTTDGGVATLTGNWTFEILDKKAIPLNRLREWFSDDVIAKAIRGAIKGEDGIRQLDGVRIFQESKASYR